MRLNLCFTETGTTYTRFYRFGSKQCCKWCNKAAKYQKSSEYYRHHGMELNLQSVVSRHRRLAGLTQSELAKQTGVGKTVIFEIEHGKESVRFDTLKKVLAALNIKILLQSPVLDRPGKESKPDSSTT